MLDQRLANFVNSALDSACQRIAAAPPGTSSETVNREAFAIGRLIGAGVLSYDVAFARLVTAAIERRRTPVGDERRSVQRALRDGERSPRDLSHVGSGVSSYRPPPPDPGHAERQARLHAEEEALAASKKAEALSLWHAAIPLTGTPGETYWHEHRGFRFRPNEDAARFHEATNAVIYPVQSLVTGEIVAIQRVFLEADGSKKEKRSLASTRGCAVVFKGSDPSKGKQEALWIAEGPETAWAIYEALWGQFTVAASLSASTLGKIELPHVVKRTVLVSDRGAEHSAEDAAKSIAARRSDIGAAIVFMPDHYESGTDAADILKREGDEALREILTTERSISHVDW